MPAQVRLVHISTREDALVVEGMRGADDTFAPGLQEAGKRFGVSIDYLPESGFTPEYIVRPPIPVERVQAFAELVTAIAIDSLHGHSYPNVRFTYQPNSNESFNRTIANSLVLVS